MPTIPDATSIRRDIQSGKQSVVSIGQTGAVASAVRGLASGIEGEVDANARYQYSRAKAAMLKAKTEVDNQGYEDVYYNNIGDTYQERFNKRRSEIEGSIGSSIAKSMFAQDADMLFTQGMAAAGKEARKKEIDVERGNLDQDLLDLRESGLNGDLVQITASAKELIEAGVAKGYYGAEEGVALFNQWKQDAAKGRLTMMPPEDRVEALKQRWAKNLNSDERAVLMRDAEEATIAVKAQEFAEGALSGEMTRFEALSEADKIVDPKLRDETVSRINSDYDRYERNVIERQNKAYQDAARILEDPDFKYDQLPDNLLDDLTVTQRQNLRAISDRGGNPRTVSDPDVLIELAAAFGRQDWNTYNGIIKDRSHLLSDSDRVTYTVKGLNEQLPKEVESGLSDVQAVAGALASANIKDKRKQSILLLEVGNWRMRETERTGKAPSDDDRRKFIDYQLINRDTNWLWGLGGGLMMERDAEEQLEILNQDNPDLVETVAAYLVKQGNDNPSAQDILDVYSRVSQ